MKNPTIISLGGSLIVPDDVDVDFLRAFVALISSLVKEGKEFVIITGGGKIARRYQSGATAVASLSSEDLDWLGIYATRFNAEFIRLLFGGLAHQDILTDPTAISKVTAPILVGAGWKPGCSTDFDAVKIAEHFKAEKLVNLSNIDYVYDKDPKNNPDAKRIEKIGWAEFRKIIPSRWDPGINVPFDPTAAVLAEKIQLEVAIMNGKNLDNFKNYLEGKTFIGSVIQ